MGLTTGIAWTDATINFWRGCVKVSPGCKECYAESLARRNPKTLGSWGPGSPRVVGGKATWDVPQILQADAARGDGRKRMFALSLGDFFEQGDLPCVDTHGDRLYLTPFGSWVSAGAHPEVAADPRSRPLTLDDCRARCLALMEVTPLVDWQILTKRAADILPTLYRIATSDEPSWHHGAVVARRWINWDYPENAWVGVSAEDQGRLHERVEHLRRVPAAVRFVSAEPLLAPLDLTPWLDRQNERDRGFSFYRHAPDCPRGCDLACHQVGHEVLAPDPFHWVIAGGESGPNARPCDVAWLRSVRDQCRAAGVPVFVKQLGTRPASADAAEAEALARLKDLKGETPAEWPEDLRVQEFPGPETE